MAWRTGGSRELGTQGSSSTTPNLSFFTNPLYKRKSFFINSSLWIIVGLGHFFQLSKIRKKKNKQIFLSVLSEWERTHLGNLIDIVAPISPGFYFRWIKSREGFKKNYKTTWDWVTGMEIADAGNLKMSSINTSLKLKINNNKKK